MGSAGGDFEEPVEEIETLRRDRGPGEFLLEPGALLRCLRPLQRSLDPLTVGKALLVPLVEPELMLRGGRQFVPEPGKKLSSFLRNSMSWL